jgi:DNA-directed RNA polymerase subunit delta
MGLKENKSLLEVAIDLLQKKKKPQKINVIIDETMQLKGKKPEEARELAPQLILDIMQSGYFVYCGDDNWDLKYREPTSVFDKDGADYEEPEEDEDVKANELKDDFADTDSDTTASSATDEEEKDSDDDLDKEFSSDDTPSSTTTTEDEDDIDTDSDEPQEKFLDDDEVEDESAFTEDMDEEK